MTKKIISITVLILLIVSVFAFRGQVFRFFQSPTETLTEKELEDEKDIKVIVENLQIPWEIAFLPNGEILVTERSGKLKKIGQEEDVFPVENVEHRGEGGLLGMALHPDFSKNSWIYLYFTTRTDNRVERYNLENEGLMERVVIISDIPRGMTHNGGRIAFGPDNYLYITTGDAGTPHLSQDLDSLAGKILRLNDDGSVPQDNPFNSPVWSYGHRNPQGLAWDEQGNLWSTEHGPVARDEINLIERGENYGWPDSVGDTIEPGTVGPVLHSGMNTWAPSGAIYYQGSLFFAGLRGSSLYQAFINEDDLQISGLIDHFNQEFGRIRSVALGPDGFIYIITSNTDGRGIPRLGDDKIIRIKPDFFDF